MSKTSAPSTVCPAGGLTKRYNSTVDKNYEHKKYEEQIYQLWEKSDAFKPSSNGDPFSIIMPPPNANDPLHVGHAMFVTVEDILIRYHRMKGDATLWLPGTDHAGIETQFVFEKKLAKQGKSRFDFDRETLYKMIWDYVQENSGIAVDQMKKLGASADWTRFKFTLDPDIVNEAITTFLRLYKQGLVYRGERLVNYCTKCGTSYSQLEVEYEERNDPLYYVKYGPFVIATARPETKFRDTALAVNPTDKRYKKYLDQTLDITGLLGPVKMTVIPDPEVDPKFGTGIMKVTPAHDPHDFELGEKFNLPVTPIITVEGKMDFSWYLDSPDFAKQPTKYQTRAKKYHGLKIAEARKMMVEDLKEDSLLEKVDDKYMHRIGTCYRCHSVIEPLPLPQFFIKTKSLAHTALQALDNKETIILGTGREKILRHWLENLRDWNISRQIVWGIRIPVWYSIIDNPSLKVTFLNKSGQPISGSILELTKKYSFGEIETGLQKITAERDAKFVVTKNRPGDDYLQETDTFDTWFSSGQWPVVTLKTSQPGDFDRFYPTSVMETGYDILPIWVMRMMLLGIYSTGKSPFKWVYLHGLIRDEKGRKMSKSIGNVINPQDMVEKYGADAVRMALVMGSTPGQDKSVGESTIRGMRNLSNKIWNAARYVDSMEQDKNSAEKDQDLLAAQKTNEQTMTKRLNDFKIGQSAEWIYHWFWHTFCDDYIEKAKKGLVSKGMMLEVLKSNLKLLHPFIPFVTEAVWQELKLDKQPLIVQHWPSA